MESERIDFISSYCDRWCERCAFTQRCSAYAVDIATGMCEGDFAAGLQLAIGAPPPTNTSEEERRAEFVELLREFEATLPTEAEMARIAEDLDERRRQIDESPIGSLLQVVSRMAQRWLDAHGQQSGRAGGVVADAVEVIGRDCYLIEAKLRRALGGRYDAEQLADNDDEDEDDEDEDGVQTDWNGSAKVALISIARSAAAWTTVARVSGDVEAEALAEQLRHLQQEVERGFPDAWKFVRPGFDEFTDNQGS